MCLLDQGLNSCCNLLKLCDEALAFFRRLSLGLVVLQEYIAHLLNLAANMVDGNICLTLRGSDLLHDISLSGCRVVDQRPVDVSARLVDVAASLGIENLDTLLLRN